MSILRAGSGECSRSDIFQGSAPSWLDNIIRRVIHVVSTVSLECDPGLFWPHFGSFDRETGPVTSVRRAGGGTSCWIQRCPRPALETPGGSTTGPSCAVLFRRSRSGVRQLPLRGCGSRDSRRGCGPNIVFARAEIKVVSAAVSGVFERCLHQCPSQTPTRRVGTTYSSAR